MHKMQQSAANDPQKNDGSANSGQETECLPEANVSIIEDMTNEDKLESMKAIVNGTMRRKLYFNPAYFEPHLLMVRRADRVPSDSLKLNLFLLPPNVLVTAAGCHRIPVQDS